MKVAHAAYGRTTLIVRTPGCSMHTSRLTLAGMRGTVGDLPGSLGLKQYSTSKGLDAALYRLCSTREITTIKFQQITPT